MARLLRWGLIGMLVCLVGSMPDQAWGCFGCSGGGGMTYREEVNLADIVVYGSLTNAKLSGTEYSQGTTDLVIETVIKRPTDEALASKFLGDKKVLTLPRYLPTDKPMKFVVFCAIYKGKLDFYRGVPASNQDLVTYLTRNLEVRAKDAPTRLRFYFDYLDNADPDIANDALKEFGNATDKDFQAMAGQLPADKIARWLEDPKTPAYRYGLYAMMLGQCGKPEHGAILRKMLDDPQKRTGSGIDGIMVGYITLQPKEGWNFLRDVMKDTKQTFLFRYAALRSVRYFRDWRPDAVKRQDLVDGVCQLLDQDDIADLAIEDLRKWGQWQLLDRILALYDRYDAPIVRRAVIRFALGCQDQAKSKAFLDRLRKADAELVNEVEEVLKLETTPAKPIATKAEPPPKAVLQK